MHMDWLWGIAMGTAASRQRQPFEQVLSRKPYYRRSGRKSPDSWPGLERSRRGRTPGRARRRSWCCAGVPGGRGLPGLFVMGAQLRSTAADWHWSWHLL